MKKVLLIMAAFALCLSLAGCGGSERVELRIENTGHIAYSADGASEQLNVTATGLGGEKVYDIIPAVDGIGVSSGGLITVGADVADGTVFTARVTVGEYRAQKKFTYGTLPSETDLSGVRKKLVKGADDSVRVNLPASFAGAPITVYDAAGNIIEPYYYELNNTRFTLLPPYLKTLSGDGKITVKSGGGNFIINLAVYDTAVSTVEEFLAIGKDGASLSRSYLITEDLDFYEYCKTNAMPQISTYTDAGTSALTGTVDGDGHVLRNITLKTVNNGGLFGHIATSGVVRNLGITDGTFEVSGNSGGIFGGYIKGTIENCFVRASTLKGSNASGFIGKEDSAKSIKNNYIQFRSVGNVKAAFAQYCKTALVNCFAYCDKPLPLLADSTRGGDVSTSRVVTEQELRSADTYCDYPTDVFLIEDGALPAYRNGNEGGMSQMTIVSDENRSADFRAAVSFDVGYGELRFYLIDAPAGISVELYTGEVAFTGVPIETEFTLRAESGSLSAEKTFIKV